MVLYQDTLPEPGYGHHTDPHGLHTHCRKFRIQHVSHKVETYFILVAWKIKTNNFISERQA